MESEDGELAARTADKAPVKKEVQSEETRPTKDLGSHQREPLGKGPRFT